MATGEEWSLAVVSLASSIIYLIVAIVFSRRQVAPEAKLAQRGFAAWWIALAVLGVFSLPSMLGFNVAEAGLLGWRLFVYTLFTMLFVGLAGLVYYLAYLYWGSPRIKLPILLYFIILTGMLVWLIEGFSPHMGVNEAGETEVLFEPEQPPGAALAFSLAFILPPLISSGAYLMLFRRVDDRESKYRIALVGGGIVLWFGFSLLNTIISFVTQTDEPTFGLQMTGALLGVLSSLLVLMAFWPPARIRRWLDQAQ